jgi:radical SAM protein with 4Fe4S-binding SPASM domain
MTTGGRGIDDALATAMKAAGIDRVSVSIDGLEAAHDRMRNLRGSFASAMGAIAALRRAGIPPLSNINLNRSNHRDLEALYEVLRDAGVRAWQVQITTPLGRAADRTDMILQPWDLIDIVPRLAAIKRRAMTEGVEILLGNNLGYFGPEEALLRSPSDAKGADHWRGCQAGKFVMGIEADGAVKGCPSLQTTSYVGGRLGGRDGDRTLRDIWDNTPELAFARVRTVDDLWGFCRTCDFAEVCMGGCTFTAHAVLGRPGNNPYCHYRARHHAKRGLRERLVPAQAAPGTPFDNGTFDIVVEPLDAPDEPAARPPEQLVQLTVSRRRVIP